MKTKYFSMYANAVDAEGNNHVVTVVGELTIKGEKTSVTYDAPIELENGKTVSGNITIPFKKNTRTLKLGYSICHPNDEFSVEYGQHIATRRIKNGNYIGELTTTNVTMLNDDQCELNVFGELNYIVKNIDKYINK